MIEIGDGPLTFILMLKSLWVGGWWVEFDYSVSSGPFLSFEIEIGDGTGPELDNNVCPRPMFLVFYRFLGLRGQDVTQSSVI